MTLQLFIDISFVVIAIVGIIFLLRGLFSRSPDLSVKLIQANTKNIPVDLNKTLEHKTSIFAGPILIGLAFIFKLANLILFIINFNMVLDYYLGLLFSLYFLIIIMLAFYLDDYLKHKWQEKVITELNLLGIKSIHEPSEVYAPHEKLIPSEKNPL